MARDSKRGAHNGSLLHFQAALMRTSLAGTQGVITHRHFLLSTIRHVMREMPFHLALAIAY